MTSTADADEARRRALADFLRTRRRRLDPAALGLPAVPRRRSPGLRREDVAALSGLSASWYARLEGARRIQVSAQVVDALARVLRLGDDEREHLHMLCRTVAPAAPRVAGADGPVVPQRLTRLVDALPMPAYVTDARLDVLAWNDAATLVLGPLGERPPDERNLLWLTFAEPTFRESLVDWELEARRLVAEFRSGFDRRPDDPRARELLRRLDGHGDGLGSFWNDHDVRPRSAGVKRLRDADGSTVTLDHHTFLDLGGAGLQLTIYLRRATG